MSSPLSRRSLLEASFNASAGLLAIRPAVTGLGLRDVWAQGTPGSFNVKDFGAKGDGASDDSGAFQSAITAAGRVNGVVLVPPSGAKYVVGRPLELTANIRIQGPGGRGPVIQFTNSNGALFTFVGTREAEELNVAMSHLTLEHAVAGSGTAIRVRNFSGLFLHHLSINHFDCGVWADWGIGVHLFGCGLAHNTRALQVGGSGQPGGLRMGDRKDDSFMDTVVIDSCSFAQNLIDINDMGSTRSLGTLAVRDSSFYEAYSNPVANKALYIRVTNRKGVTVSGNWFECGQPLRTLIYIGNVDLDGAPTGICHGVTIFGNDFLHTGRENAVGIDLVRCEAATIFSNCFEFASANAPIRLADTVGISTVLQNAYVTYPDRDQYPNPLTGAVTHHQILDPRLQGTTHVGGS